MVMMVLAGCTSLRGKADAAYANGNYIDAAGMYEQIGDSAHRDQARTAELRAELWRVQNDHGSLEDLLAHRDMWQLPSPAGLDAVTAAASDRIRRAVAQVTYQDGPLAGEAELANHAALLAHADFATTRDAIRSHLAEVARTRCDQLGGITDTPYWQALVARYCGHFEIAREVPPLPDHQRALTVDGGIDGETDIEVSAMQGALAAAFHRSAWYAPTATATRHAKVDGGLRASYSSQQVTLTATWTESVPYTDYETTQESYQEPYDDTETYDEQVPDTQWVQCGDSTCPETVYHTETKTRTVTKYRTAWRDVTIPVTKYRDEQRSEDYQATERTGSYDAQLRVTFDSGLAAVSSVSTTQTGVDHDVTIAAAGVSPQRANLPSEQDFAASEQADLAQKMIEALDAEYGRRFCNRPAYTLEQAAECAYGAHDLPAAAVAALHEALGGDTRYLANTASL